MDLIIKKLPQFTVIFLIVSVFIFSVLDSCTKFKEKDVDKDSKRHQLSTLLDYKGNKVSLYPKKILNNLRKADPIAIELQDSNSILKINLKKSDYFQRFEQYDSALFYAIKALKWAKAIKNDTFLVKANNEAGNIYADLNDYATASKYYSNALDLAEAIQDSIGIATLLTNIGIIYSRINEPDRAIQCYNKAKSIFDLKHDDYRKSMACINLIFIYTNSKHKDNANIRQYYSEAYPIFQKTHDTVNISKLLINMSTYYKQIGQIDSAKRILISVLKNVKMLSQKRLYAMVLNNLGTLYFRNLNNLKKGKQLIDSSFRISQETSDLNMQMINFSALSEIEIKRGNYKQGYQYYQKLVELRDSIIGGDVKKTVITNNLQNKIDKREYEAKLLQQKLNLKGKQNQVLYISIFSILVFVIMLGSIIRASYRNLKKTNTINELENQRLEEQLELDRKINEIEKLKIDTELETKEKELVGFSLKLIAQNDLLNKISKLSEKYYSNNVLDRQYFNELSNIIEDNFNYEREWNQFKKLFEKIHHHFFNNLKENFPGLTEHELRFCAYLKISLQTKEIARLLNISPNAVRTFRYRLKKKFGLNPETSIEEFLRNI